jgi:hypothetical protein
MLWLEAGVMKDMPLMLKKRGKINQTEVGMLVFHGYKEPAITQS